MKLLTILFFVALQGLGINPGEGDALYLNDRLDPVKEKDNATYYYKMEEKTPDGFHFKVYFLTGEVKMEGVYKDSEMKIAHGQFVFYYRNGQTESVGVYREGNKYGIWQRYQPDGTPKAEKIYALQPMLQAIKPQNP
jgi:antitoxin component YwqK of YwqJK toxin-antitoxin module